MTALRSQASRTVRILLATIALLLGVIAALFGGILQRLDGNSLSQSFQYGCGAFGATVLLSFALMPKSPSTQVRWGGWRQILEMVDNPWRLVVGSAVLKRIGTH